MGKDDNKIYLERRPNLYNGPISNFVSYTTKEVIKDLQSITSDEHFVLINSPYCESSTVPRIIGVAHSEGEAEKRMYEFLKTDAKELAEQIVKSEKRLRGFILEGEAEEVAEKYHRENPVREWPIVDLIKDDSANNRAGSLHQ